MEKRNVKKTAVDIKPALFKRAKVRAAQEETTLRQLIEEGLELRLAKKKGWKP